MTKTDQIKYWVRLYHQLEDYRRLSLEETIDRLERKGETTKRVCTIGTRVNTTRI